MAGTANDWLALPSGSDEELIANFLRGASERRFRHLCALRDTIQQAPGRSREPAVAAVKLEWWREELGRLAAGEARHPLTTGLQSLLPAGHALLPWLEELVIASESLHRRETPDSFAELRLLCFRREGAALAVAAGAAADGASQTGRIAAARHAGIAWALAKTTASLAAGRAPQLMPRDLVADHDLAVSTPSERSEVVRTLAHRGLAELERANAHQGDAATAIVTAVTRTNLEARCRSPDHAAHPLELLWRAWRAARRHDRLHRAR